MHPIFNLSSPIHKSELKPVRKLFPAAFSFDVPSIHKVCPQNKRPALRAQVRAPTLLVLCEGASRGDRGACSLRRTASVARCIQPLLHPCGCQSRITCEPFIHVLPGWLGFDGAPVPGRAFTSLKRRAPASGSKCAFLALEAL